MRQWHLSDILAVVTAFQLFLLGAVILTSRKTKGLSQRLLAAFLLANFLLLVQFEGLGWVRPARIGVSPFYFLLGPLLYLFVRSLLVRSFRLTRADLLHLVPFAMAFTYSVAAFLLRGTGEWQNAIRNESTANALVLNIQIAGYLILIFATFRRYRSLLTDHFAEVKHISLNWLLFILLAFALMWMTDLSSTIVSWAGIKNPEWQRGMLLVSIGINFVFATILVYRSMEQSWEQTGIIEATRYAGSSLSEEESAGYARKITNLMEKEKVFLDPEISLKELSEVSGISTRHLSQVINSRFNQNFFDFINHYRIEEAKRLMAGKVRRELTTLEVMYQVGFNSKSSFQAAFRKYTGTTPTEFRQRTMN
jgi:AraC-like DNA-binding protein